MAEMELKIQIWNPMAFYSYLQMSIRTDILVDTFLGNS